MRLIDADELMDFISEHAEQIQYAIEHKDMEILEPLIKQIPTAYDVEKVIDEFEEIQDKAVSVKNEDISIYATGMMGKAIEIVKGGGIKWYTN